MNVLLSPLRRRIGALGAGLIIALGFVALTPVAAQADESELYQHVYNWYLDHGVSSDDADRLAQMAVNGIVAEASTEGAVPISVVTTRRGDFTETVRIYSDGSLAVSSVEAPTPVLDPERANEARFGVAPRTVNMCEATSSGSGWATYTGCRASEETAMVSMSFRADWWRNYGPSTNVGGITAVRTPYAYVFGGTASTPSLVINKATSNASGPARATASTTFSAPWSSGDISLSMNVTGVGASTSKSGF